ncbi:nucleoside 2-deoxyribosyltransferase [Atopobacter phocae]|uniref:nucleoside 2-deoxyribosyltransferase n=1 Tax=Atopobacter phocae TaxID=136492 RepID=UPI000470E754|nr:nucleoside 2-deoxyribosyltransferase [Atopobacter phocae]
MKIYFAAPLFSESEQLYNATVVEKIRATYPEVAVYLPQEAVAINDKNSFANSQQIAQYDTDELLASQLVIAVLDGITIDAGVASEIGVAFQAGIPILGLFTDVRQNGATNQQKLDALQEVAESQFPYVNLYTAGLIKKNGKILSSSSDLIAEIQQYLPSH